MPDLINDRCVDIRERGEHLPWAPGERDHEARPSVPRPYAHIRAARRLQAVETACHHWLVAHSIALLRISLGAVFLGFGFLKFFPGVSPAEGLVIATTSKLTLGLVPGSIALVAIAVLECIIGLWLLSGRALRGAIYLLAVELIGILSPAVLLAGRLFSGPHHAPTMQGQYVLKDVILVAAVLVIAATAGGGRLTSSGHPSPPSDP